MNPNRVLRMSFTVAEWQLICAACARVKPTSLIDQDGSKIKRLREIAKQLAVETGKANDAVG